MIRKLSGKHTAQTFSWDDESRLVEVSTTRRPGTEHQSTQVTRFDYDALGRRVAKHDSFGSTVFIWEGMRLIEERRGSSVISYVYEPGSYVPLARLDASGEKTDQGGLGTQDDAVLPPLPHAGEGGGEGHPASKTIAARASQTSATGPNHSQPAANDAESLYWASLNQQAEQKAQALAIEGWGTGTDGPQRQVAQAKIAEVYYFHTDQVGLPEELSNSQGQLVWQATYKTWGNTQAEEWKLVEADGSKTHPLDAGDQPENEARQQNLRFQGQYLDRDTELHYNTFRFFDPDIGRFISPDPIGLIGGINLGSYSPNPISWIDPLGWMPLSNPVDQGHHMVPWQMAEHYGKTPFNSQTGVPAMYWNQSQWTGIEHSAMHGYNGIGVDTKPVVKPTQAGSMTADQWMTSLEKHYNNPALQNIRGDLHLIDANGKKGVVIGTNLSPAEAWQKVKAWGKANKSSC